MNITVVIPVYNVENYLLRAIDSVLSQSEVDELILVEDGSMDSSKQICIEAAATHSRIILLEHTENKNKGVSASRNLGIKNASNEFIAFLDADDYYLPNRFKQTAVSFAADESIEGVYEMIGQHSNAGEIKNYSIIESVSPNELFENLQPIGVKVWFSIDGLTVKKTVFDKAGLFDESLQTSEDTLQWFKIAAVSRLEGGNIQSPVTITESRNNSLTTDQKLVQKDFVLMLFKLFEYCKKLPAKNSRKELVLAKLFYFAAAAPFNQQYKGLKKNSLFLKIILTDPVWVIFRSKTFRHNLGNMIAFNKFLNFFNKYKQAK
jgi:glycosyltransferase involved in cell wall biosynthesis